MADAKKCDRCGKFYMPLEFNTKHKSTGDYENGRPIVKLTIHTFGIYNDLDICPECGEAFREWFGEDATRLK